MITRINRLIKDIQREPYTGIGKPEPLKHSLAGYWSRRINDEHRIVYKAEEDQIFIAQLWYITMNVDCSNIPTQWKPYKQWKED